MTQQRDALLRLSEDRARWQGEGGTPLALVALTVSAQEVNDEQAWSALARARSGWVETSDRVQTIEAAVRSSDRRRCPVLSAEWLEGDGATSVHLRRGLGEGSVLTTMVELPSEGADDSLLCLVDERLWMSTAEDCWLRYKVYWRLCDDLGGLKMVAARFSGLIDDNKSGA